MFFGGQDMRRSKGLVSIVVVMAFLFQIFSMPDIVKANSISQVDNYFSNDVNQIKKVEVSDIPNQEHEGSQTSGVITNEAVEKNVQIGDSDKDSVVNGEESEYNDEILFLPSEDSKIGKNYDNYDKNIVSRNKDIIVVYKDINKAAQTRNNFISKKEARVAKAKYTSKRFNMEVIEVTDKENIEIIIKELESDPNVAYVQPDYVLETFLTPKDEYFEIQWGLENNGQVVKGQTGKEGIDINVKDAWDIATGSSVTIAVIDTGFDINHPDIADNIFYNTGEIPGNGIDDDGNGFIDDVQGWDFVNNDNSVDDLRTGDVHGTHVMGVIAAKSNDIGIAGTAPDAKILPIKFIEGNSGKTSDAVKAIEYALAMGADIINCSWGGYDYNPVLKKVMEQSDALFICAAGNSSSNNNVRPVYPASFELDNIISVAAIESNGELAAYSNYGSNVDIAAPGTNVLSIFPHNRYDYLSGTSMAAAFVSGVAALIKSSESDITNSEIKSRILSNVTEATCLSGKVNTSGMLNAYAALINQVPPKEEQEDDEEDNSLEPSPIYDTSAEGNNKTPKPIISEEKLFIDSVDDWGIPNVVCESEGISNLNIFRIKENYITVTWATYAEASSEFYFGDTEILGQSYIIDELTTKHQITVMLDDNTDIKYYMVKSITQGGDVFQTEVRSVEEDIVDLGGKAPELVETSDFSGYDFASQDVSILSYINDNGANHSIDTAQAVNEGIVFGTMETSDEWDYYSISYQAGKTYTMRLTGMDPHDDFDLYLYNSSGSTIGYSVASKGFDDIISYTVKESGVYFVAVRAYAVNSLAQHHNYQLLIYSKDNAPDEYEPNDSMSTAKAITVNTPVLATLNINTDEDWFVIDATKTGKLTVTLKSIPEGCDYDLEVYRDNGIRLSYSYASGNLDEKAVAIINTVGKYYIRVYSHIGSNPEDTYELKAFISIPDSYEINDSIYDARYYGRPSIKVDSSINDATIDNPDDHDFYVLDIDAESNIGIRLENIPAGNDYNLVLYTYSIYSGFYEVGRSIHSGNTDESIVKQLPGGRYYIQVYSASGFSETESYTLSVKNEINVSKVYAEIDKTTASVGDIVTVTIKVKDIDKMAGIDLNFAYDPNVVMPVKDDLSPYDDYTIPQGMDILAYEEDFPLFKAAGHLTYKGYLKFGFNIIDLKAYREFITDPQNAVSDDVTGTVAVIKFKVLRNNQIQFKFVDERNPEENGVQLFNYYGAEIIDGVTVEQPQIVNENLPVYKSEMSGLFSNTNTSQQTTICTSSSCTISGYIGIDIGITNITADMISGFTISYKRANSNEVLGTVTTDSNGYFEINRLQSGYYDITITKDLYVTREIKNIATIWEETVIGTIEDPIMMWIGDLYTENEKGEIEAPDGVINIKDIVQLSKSFNAIIGEADYIESYDINKDGAINLLDIMILAKNYNKGTSNYPEARYKLFKNETFESFTLARGILDLNGHTLTISGDLIIDEPTSTGSATLYINGGTLLVGGNLLLSGMSRLIMRNSGDYILVNGNFETRSILDHKLNNARDRGGDGKPCLTDGVLEVKGDFWQRCDMWKEGSVYNVNYFPGDPRNFTTMENHKVILSGADKQVIMFDRVVIEANIDQSYFQTLVITKTLEYGYEVILNKDTKDSRTTVAWLNLIEDFANYNPGEGTTEELEPITIPRGGVASATIGAKIYSFGGYNGNYLKVIEEYDPIMGKWTQIDSTNQHRFELEVERRDSSVIEIDNQIYVIGGENANGYVSEVEQFSNVTGSAVMRNMVSGINKCDMPTPRTKVAVAAIGSKIYAIGGYNGSYSNKVEVFDTSITVKAWTTQCVVNGQTRPIANMPTARSGAAAVEFDGYIYVLGGYNGSTYLSTVERYDPVNNKWTTCKNMLYPRANFAAHVIDGKIFAIGGYNGVDHLAVVEVYDPQTDKWTKEGIKPIIRPGSTPPVEEPRSSFGSAVVYNQIYLIGGESNDGYLSRTQKYVPVNLPGLVMFTGVIPNRKAEDILLAGNYTTSVSDIKIDSPGVPIELLRTYDSSEKDEKTFIGNGWRFNYDSYLTEITHYGRVTASRLNIREGAGIKYKSYGLAERGSILVFETVNNTPVKVNDSENRPWYKVKLRDGRIAYAASWHVDAFTSGVEIKLAAGQSLFFDGDKTSGFTAPHGNYDKLAYISSTQEYVLVKSDMTRYGYKKISGGNEYRLVWIEDKYKNRINIAGEYNGNIYRIKTVSDNSGRSLTFDYSTSNKVTVTDNIGRQVQNLLDGSTGHLEQVVNIYGKDTKYSYYTAGEDISEDKKNVNKLNEVQIRDSETGKFVTIQRNFYDESSGRVYKQTDAYNKVKYWRYIDPVGDESVDIEVNGKLERQFTDENNETTSIEYSSFLKQPIREEYPDGSVIEHKYKLKLNNVWIDTTNLTSEQNKQNNILSSNRASREYIKDAYGYTTVEERDVNGNIVKVTNKFVDDGTDTSFNSAPYKEYEYDYSYNASSAILRNNLITEKEVMEKNDTDAYTRYEYSGTNKEYLEKIKKRIEGDTWATTIYTYYNNGENGYKINGLVKTVTDPDGKTTTYSYKTNGYLYTMEDPLGNKTIYEFDGVGRKTSEISPMKFKTEYIYEDNGKVEKVIVNDGDGNTKAITRSSISKTVYDGYGRKIQEVTPKQYEEDPNAEGTKYVYDLNGRLKTVTVTLSNGEQYVTEYTYDNVGNIQTEKRPDGTIYIYEYDDMNRLKKESFKSDEYVVTPVVLKEYEYKKENNKTNPALKDDVNIVNIYFENGVYTPDNCIQTKVTTDYLNQRQTIEETGKPTVVKQYLKNGKLNYEKVGSYNTYYGYDGLGRITAKRIPLEVKDGVILYTKYRYTYDSRGNIKMEETGVEKVSINDDPQNYLVKKYQYDDNGRLKKVIVPEGELVEYEYDSDGNVNVELTNTKDMKYNIIRYENNHMGKPDRKLVFVEPEDIFGVDVDGNTNYVYAIVTDYIYDTAGNVVQESTVFSELDSFDNYSVVRTFGSPVVVSYIYDNINRLKTVKENGEVAYGTGTQKKNLTTTIEYKSGGRIKQVKDAKNNVTEYEYTYVDTGKVEKVTNTVDGQKLTSATYYDWAGRVIAEVAPEDYDNNKSLNQMNRIVYIYSDNRLVEKRYKGTLTEFDPWTLSYYTKNIDQLISRYEYDEYGNVIKEYNAIGYMEQYYTEYQYNLIGKVTKMIDPETQNLGDGYYTAKYDYDTMGRMISEIRYKGYSAKPGESIKYIENGQAESSFYVKTEYSYDYSGNVWKKWVKKGTTENINVTESDLVLDNEYDLSGNLTRSTDANGNTTEYKYNALNKVRSVVYPIDDSMKYNNPSGEAYQVNYQYDAMGNVRREYDNLQKVVLYNYDDRGLLQSQTEQREVIENGKVVVSETITTYTRYDENGNKRFKTDGNGNETEYIYDSLNRLKKTQIVVNNLDGQSIHSTEYGYDKNGNVKTVKETVQRGGTISSSTVENHYDQLGRLIEKVDAYGKAIEKFIYDQNSRQIYSVDALNNKTEYVYDKNDRLIKTIDPLGHYTEQSYDNAGNVRTIKDGEGYVTTYIYDEFDRLWYVINAKGQKTKYTYDKNGNMLTQQILSTDLKNNIDTVISSTTNEYNAANLITKRIGHGGRTVSADGTYQYDYRKVTEYEYDPNGMLREKIDRSSSATEQNGAVTIYDYDIHGRLKTQTTSKAGENTVVISYQYDNNGNTLKVIDSTGETIRTYDEFNRVKSKNVPGIGTVRYYYDIMVQEGMDYLTAEKSVDPKNNKTTKVYDKAGRLKYVFDGEITSNTSINSVDQSKLTTYVYKDNGARESVQYPTFVENGETYRYEEVYTYYEDGLLETLVNRKVKIASPQNEVEDEIERYYYEYDNAHNLKRKQEYLQNQERTSLYTYTELNQLEMQIEAVKIIDKNQAMATYTIYTYDLLGNRATESIRKGGETVSYTYKYDEQNQLEKIIGVDETKSYTYDERGNLKEVTETVGSSAPQKVAEYSYDLLNRLIKAKSGANTSEYAYNGEGLRVKKDGVYYLYDYDKVILEVSASGEQIGRNIYGTNLLMRTAKENSGNKSYYYMYNGHADVTALVSTLDNKVVATYYYDPFGNIDEIGTTGDVNNSITYAGYQYDKETGLYYLNARMYDPKIARFLQEDTYTGDPKDPLSLNLYTYCANNPLIYFDPTGHSWLGANDYQTYLSYIEERKKAIAKKQIEQGKIIDLKMRNDKSVEKIVLGSRELEHSSLLFLQDEIYYRGILRVEVIGENIKEYTELYSKTRDEIYLELLKNEYVEYLANIQTYSELGFKIEDFKFVKDDDYYKTLYNIYYRKDNFMRWLLLERNLETLFTEAQNHIKSGLEIGKAGLFQNLSLKMQESTPYSNIKEPYSMKVNDPKHGSETDRIPQIIVNNEVGTSFEVYVEGTKLRGVAEQGLLEKKEKFLTPDVVGKKYVRPDFSIYDTNGNLAAIADAKTSSSIPYDAQAQGLIKAAQTTKSKTLIYYTPTGNSVIDPRILLEAQDVGVTILQIGVR